MCFVIICTSSDNTNRNNKCSHYVKFLKLKIFHSLQSYIDHNMQFVTLKFKLCIFIPWRHCEFVMKFSFENRRKILMFVGRCAVVSCAIKHNFRIKNMTNHTCIEHSTLSFYRNVGKNNKNMWKSRETFCTFSFAFRVINNPLLCIFLGKSPYQINDSLP